MQAESGETSSFISSTQVRGWLVTIGILVMLVGLPALPAASLWYSETQGPFKNSTQVVDLEGDGDLDVVVSHTRWEAVDISWAGIGRWINQGEGQFELLRDHEDFHYASGAGNGFAAGVGDVDNDGDADIFVQNFQVRLLQNQGGAQGGVYKPNTGMNPPPSPYNGYRDMGGSIEMGDLNGDGKLDAFVAGCCYGMDATGSGDGYPHDPSLSWVWINDGRLGSLQSGHTIRMEALDGLPIRGAALGDLDGDGDVDVFAAVGKPTMGTVDSIDDVILLNDGSGNLRRFDQPLGDTDSTSVALGDVNADGRLDALVGTSEGANLWINQGGAASSSSMIFAPAQKDFGTRQTVGEKLQVSLSSLVNRALGWELAYGSIRTKGVALSDLDGDGDLDALIARIWRAEVWWNDGLGQFTRSDVRLAYDEDTGVAVADFDGDGDQDVFAAGNADGYHLWFNDGQGAFSE